MSVSDGRRFIEILDNSVGRAEVRRKEVAEQQQYRYQQQEQQ